MTGNPLEAKAHELIAQLNPGRLAAVVQLLEVMVAEEPVTDEDRRRFLEGQSSFASGQGIAMESILAEFGLRPEDFPLSK